MGSLVEMNDTLQITKEQGFPQELDLEKHLQNPFKMKDFQDKIFHFHGKEGIRMYQILPVRNFLVENKNGKWIYWGLVHVLEVTHDYIQKITSGTFRIIHIYTPEEMKQAHDFIDRNKNTQFFEKN